MSEAVTFLKKNKHIDADRKILSLLGCLFLFYAGTYTGKSIICGIGLPSLQRIGSLIFYLFWIYKLGVLLLKNPRLIMPVVAADVLFVLILVLNGVLFPITQKYYDESRGYFQQILFAFLPCGVLISKCKNFDNAFLYMRKYARIGIFLMLFSLPLDYMENVGAQYWGIHLAPFGIIIWANYLDYRKKYDLALSILVCALIVLGGRQSFLMVYLIYFALFVHKIRNNSKKMVFLYLMVAFFALFVMLGGIEAVAQKLLDISGSDSSLLERLASGELFSTDTRQPIYSAATTIIMRNGAKVTGILGNRYLIQNFTQYSEWMKFPHNIYLELLIDFGTIWGAIFSIALTLCSIKSVLCKNESKSRLSLVIVLIVFLRLLVSNSYIWEGCFFVLLGLLMNQTYKSHRRRSPR